MTITGVLTDAVDTALDRSVVLGYTKLGSGIRKLWWPPDPPPKAMAGKRVVVTGARCTAWCTTPGRCPRNAAKASRVTRSSSRLMFSARM